MAVPNLDNAFGKDGSARSTDGYKGSPSDDLQMQDDARNAGSISEADFPREGEGPDADDDLLLQLARDAYSQATTYHQTAVRPAWVRSYRAFANKHFDGSKYGSPEYRGRSKLFRPKTRSAVKKHSAQAAQALFSTGDIVSISAQNDADPFQVASAALKQELMNYRLSRSTQRNGIRWFMIALGALQDSDLTGICASKQTWKFKERKFTKRVLGSDNDTGEAIDAQEMASEIVVDRPDIQLYAPENVLFDPNANWENPAQTAQYMVLRNPMSADDAATFIKDNLKNQRIPFRNIGKETLMQYVDSTGPQDAIGARAAREQGKDPIMLTSGAFGRLWINEWFMRLEGEDYCFWTINQDILLSDPVPVREAYPEQGGERPVVIGYGELEAHRAFPMAPAESWQPMQAEINDQVNLRIDHMKRVVAPPMQIRRGQKVDTTQLQRMGPNGQIMVNNVGDVTPFEIPDVPQSAFVENNYLNQDFDDLSGAFNPVGTEQSNAGASETFGGLSLLANGAATMGEFQLTIFVETWIAPVLAQVMKLEEMYEADATVLEICGQRAKLLEKFGMDAITDKMLMAETSLTIKAGVGSSAHPMENLQKFQAAMGALVQFFTPFVQAGKMQMPMPRAKEVIDFVFGAVSIQEGGERFFANLDVMDQPPPQQPPPPDPKAQAMMQANQIKQQQVQVTAQKAQLDSQTKMAALQQKSQDTQIKAQQASADRTAEIAREHMRALAEIRAAELKAHEARGMQYREHGHARGMQALGTFHDMLRAGANAALRPEPNQGASAE